MRDGLTVTRKVLKTKMKDGRQTRTCTGKVRSEPLNETRVRFRSDGMGNMPRLMVNIPQPGA